MTGGSMTIFYIGGERVGILGLLTILSHKNHKIIGAKSYYPPLSKLLAKFHIKQYELKDMPKCDIILCVHGREMVKKRGKYGSFNVHPFLYKYKGARPIERALKDNCKKASVGIHRITNDIDCGEVIKEKFVKVSGTTVNEIYNELYSTYIDIILWLLIELEKYSDKLFWEGIYDIQKGIRRSN